MAYGTGKLIQPGYAIVCGDTFVKLDASSGGYPYLVDEIIQAHFWKDKAEAAKYLAMFKGEIEGKVAEVKEVKIWFSTEG